MINFRRKTKQKPKHTRKVEDALKDYRDSSHVKRSSNPPTKKKLTTATLKYVDDYDKAIKYENENVDYPIEVDKLASKIAQFYERVRRIVDWKDEHLMRRSCIERVLKRRLITKVSGKNLAIKLSVEEMSEPFVEELLRTGHFSKKKTPKAKINEIQIVLDKYIYILKNNHLSNRNSGFSIKKKVEFYNWLVEIASCEVEEVLDYPYKELALIELMTNTLYKRIIIVPEKEMSNEEKYIQSYLAVHRSIFNLDTPIITYHLIKHKYPNFTDNSDDSWKFFCKNIEKIWEEMRNHLNHPHRGKFFEITEKYNAAYLILGDTFETMTRQNENPSTVIKDTRRLNHFIRIPYKKRLETLAERLTRSAIYSTVSIFVTSAVSLFILEFPVAKLVFGEFKPLAIVADILIPTMLMFILVALIKPPSKENYNRIKDEISNIVYRSEKPIRYEIILNKKVGKTMTLTLSLIYLVAGFGSLYIAYLMFKVAGVPWTSLYIDVANVAVVVFAAMVIRHKSKEITISEDEGFFELVLNFFSVPLAKIGMWFSNKWKEYNFISLFLNALVDTPFSAFITTIAEWRKFIKQKRAEIH